MYHYLHTNCSIVYKINGYAQFTLSCKLFEKHSYGNTGNTLQYVCSALISFNSCLTNAQIILNYCVTSDYLSYSLMITTLGTNYESVRLMY